MKTIPTFFQRPGVFPPQVADFSDLAAGLAEYERIHGLRRELLLRAIPAAYRQWVFVKLPRAYLDDLER